MDAKVVALVDNSVGGKVVVLVGDSAELVALVDDSGDGKVVGLVDDSVDAKVVTDFTVLVVGTVLNRRTTR